MINLSKDELQKQGQTISLTKKSNQDLGGNFGKPKLEPTK